RRLHEALPSVALKQTYGLSEVGILRTKSREDGSLWMRMGGEGYRLRVVDGQLEILAEAAMLGYLNAPSPFTEDGWFRTGDAVEVDGEWMRVLGRTSEIINVGGEKVYPAEVEGVLQRLDGVLDAAVHGEAHPLVGQIVVARLQLEGHEDLASLRRRVRAHCAGKLEPFKIPQKIELAAGSLHGQRWKKKRSAA
ncbi:MAG: long-chain fatty acid--CoA ligase, partial [Acidimicrobiales bacterium]|nr:long-chain fatty acid--CoA ligase [Acidimicrobiales bacterium]